MTLEQTIAIMAATIYAAKRISNDSRKRLDTLRKEANEEARALIDVVRGIEE